MLQAGWMYFVSNWRTRVTADSVACHNVIVMVKFGEDPPFQANLRTEKNQRFNGATVDDLFFRTICCRLGGICSTSHGRHRPGTMEPGTRHRTSQQVRTFHTSQVNES